MYHPVDGEPAHERADANRGQLCSVLLICVIGTGIGCAFVVVREALGLKI